MPRPRFAGVLVAAFTLCSCLTSGAAAEPLDIGAARKQIDAVNADWLPALEAGDADRATRGYSEDAVWITSSGKLLAGRTALMRFLKDRLKSSGKIVGGHVDQEGLQDVHGLLLEWGRATTVIEDPTGKQKDVTGTYVTLWRRNPDGRWLIIRNISE